MNVSQLAAAAKESSFQLASLSTEIKNKALAAMAQALRAHAQEILAANQLDLQAAQNDKNGLKKAMYERLKLTEEKLKTVICGLEELKNLPDPVGRVLARTQLDEGLVLEKVACPLGLIGVIFESRPDVAVQLAGLAVKSGNALILKGGKEALNTNTKTVEILKDALATVKEYPLNTLFLLSSREETAQMLALDSYFDLIIPRGGNALISYVKANTKIPVLGHADGVCHIYIAPSADLEMACKICVDAKTQYPAACNTMETLLLDARWPHGNQLALLKTLVNNGVQIYSNEKDSAWDFISGPVEDFHTEYGDKKLSVKRVRDMLEAISHINRYGSHHTDGIVSADDSEAQIFMDLVDSAGVYHNASTRFADGYRYGFGAEVGISTAKTHARGPVGLEGLTIYKYKLVGKGHIVADYMGPHAKKFTHKKLEVK